MSEGTIPTTLLDRFNGILDRFSAAINALARKKPSASPVASSSEDDAPPPKDGDAAKPGGASPGASVSAGSASEQQKTEALIAGEEGMMTKAYQNPGDVPTIGYGQTRINGRAVKLGDTMTKEQAVVGLRQNIDSHRAVAVRNIGQESWDKIKDENSKAVLTSLAYNYGHVPDVVVAAAKTGDPVKIASAVESLSVKGTKGYDSRLIGRRKREAEFIRTGSSPKLDKDFLPGGKLAAAGSVTTPPKETPAKVEPAKTQQQTQQQLAQSVSQPPPQQQTQVTVAPMNMASPQAQSTPATGKAIPPPAMSKGGMSVPFLSSSNDDNFLSLYSKMVYNVIDG